MSTNYTEEEQVTINLLEQHVNAELRGDLATTTSTMTDAPHLLNIPNMMGGDDYAGVKRFYENHLVGKFFPPDVEMHHISLTVGKIKLSKNWLFILPTQRSLIGCSPKYLPQAKKLKLAW